MKKKDLKGLKLNKNIISCELNNINGGNNVPKDKIKVPSNTCASNCGDCTEGFFCINW